jgi:hypothetical protein
MMEADGRFGENGRGERIRSRRERRSRRSKKESLFSIHRKDIEICNL